MADNLNVGDELDSTIVAEHNKSSKNTNEVWEYEAPHFFDFNQMDDQSNHDGDDNYFCK